MAEAQAQAQAALQAQRVAQQRAAQARASFQAAFAPPPAPMDGDPGRARPTGDAFGQPALADARPAPSPYRSFPSITTPWAPR